MRTISEPALASAAIVGGVSVGHRLDDNGGATADDNVTDADDK